MFKVENINYEIIDEEDNVIEINYDNNFNYEECDFKFNDQKDFDFYSLSGVQLV